MELEEITEEQRLKLLDTALAYGNHKSAQTYSDHLLPSLEKEVKRGWHLPLPIERLHEIPHIIAGPMGAVPQGTLDDHGRASIKYRLTPDPTFDHDLEGIKSVNQRVLTESLSRCVYGHALRRLAHAVIALRGTFPGVAILIGKLVTEC